MVLLPIFFSSRFWTPWGKNVIFSNFVSPEPSAYLAQSRGCLKGRVKMREKASGATALNRSWKTSFSTSGRREEKMGLDTKSPGSSCLKALSSLWIRRSYLSSVDSGWGQGGQAFWESRKLWNGYLENMRDGLWGSRRGCLSAFRISFTFSPIFCLLPSIPYCLFPFTV